MTNKNEINKAKKIIDNYILETFGHHESFENLEEIGLVYTTLTDYEIPIQISVDLVNMKLKTWLGTDITDGLEPIKSEKITLDELESMLDFQELISGWSTYIEENIEIYL